MRPRLGVFALLVPFLAVAASAEAQRRPARGPVPAVGMNAVTVSAGVAVPIADDLTSGFSLAGSAEHYFTRRLSLRAQLGSAWSDIDGHSYEGSSNPVSVLGNGVYNWEGGRVHPYVTAGAGWYRYRLVENDRLHADNNVGLNIGGGIEYFLGRRDALIGEVLFHYVPDRAVGVISTYDPRFWTVMGGYKSYF